METAPTPRPYPDHPYWDLLLAKEDMLHIIAEYEELARDLAFRYDTTSDPQLQAGILEDLKLKQQVIASCTDQLTRIESGIQEQFFMLSRLLSKDHLS